MKQKLFLIVTLIGLLSGCQSKEEPILEPISQHQFLLGTSVNITLYDNPEQEIFDEIFDAITKIEQLMTINNASTSEVIEINQQAGNTAVSISPETFHVIKEGLYYSNLGKGKFDITVGPLVKLWEIGFDNAHVPSEEEIQASLPLINYQDVELNETTLSVKLKHPNMMLDLGSIAKGYAADVAASILEAHGNNHAIINLGGNVFAYGDKPNGNQWKIGIQNPFSPRGEYFGIVSVTDQAIVTSGTYERNFQQDGVLYHHILDPQTGYPVDNYLMSVTIIADESMKADALSTLAFSLGIEDGLNLIESLDGVEALYTTQDKKLYASSNFYSYFELTDDSFTIIQ